MMGVTPGMNVQTIDIGDRRQDLNLLMLFMDMALEDPRRRSAMATSTSRLMA